MVRAAEGYRESRVRDAQGDTSRFLAMLKEYRLAKTVTRRRLYLEAIGEVLSKVDKVVISPSVAGKTLPVLQLGELGGAIQAPAVKAPARGSQ
jgi:membrane protease subunit HflK